MHKHAVSLVMGLLFAVVVALPTIVRADDTAEEKTNDQFTVTLNDGSSIICRPRVDSIPFNTSFAEMKIPLARVQAIEVTHKEKAATIIFLNGDRLAGECLLGDVTVASILGDLTIPLVHITKIETTLKKEPVFKDSPANRAECINNLRQIDSGKEQWALANRMGDTAPSDVAGVNAYIKHNRTPVCPSGGTYIYGAMNEHPRCSVPGHALRE